MISAMIMDLLVHIYIILEQIVFVYCQELKIQRYYQYFDELAQLDCTEPVNVVEVTPFTESNLSNQAIQEIENPIFISELNEAAEDLFADLQLELNSIEQDVEEIEEDIVYHIPSDYEEYENDEDCIHLSDLQVNEELEPTGFESYASAKIGDGIDGPQQWVVSIVGMEESYIHVSDGNRIWLNVEEKAHQLYNGDVLILDVIREGKQVSVENLFRLEMNATDEYTIPDEEYPAHYQDKLVI